MTRFASTVLSCALLASCGSGKPEDSGPGGVTVLYARGDQTDSLDPPSTEWGGSAKIMQNIYEALVTFSPDGIDLVPRLAEKWERSADGKTWMLEKPNSFLDRSFDPARDWEGRHTAGYVVFRDRMWIVGSFYTRDPINYESSF